MLYGLVRVMFILVCFFLLVRFFLQMRPEWRSFKMNVWESPHNERGQGLVEYALILVLVAVVVIAALLLLGPAVGNVFSEVTTALQDVSPAAVASNPVTSSSAARTGLGNGNDVVVNFEVSSDGSTPVVVTDSQSGESKEISCSGTCSVTFTGVGFESGTVTIEAGGQTSTITYPAK